MNGFKVTMIVFSILLLALAGYFAFYFYTMRDVKEPGYTILKSDGAIELREYSSLLIAQVTVNGDRSESISKGFRLLADFIFGNNKAANDSQQKIAMTTPVLQQANQSIAMTAPVMQQAEAADSWTVRFVMPAQYSMATLPKPNNSQVKIIEMPPKKVVVIRFSGSITENSLNKHLLLLKQYIADNKLQVNGEPEYAFYNPPWTLPFMRRNEIMFNLLP